MLEHCQARGGDSVARPKWIPKDVWKFVKHGKRPKIIPKKIWKMLKEGVRMKATEEAVKLLEKIINLLKQHSYLFSFPTA